MIKTQYKQFLGTPISIEVSGLDDARTVSIFMNDYCIGEYIRNHQHFTSNTFCPFLIGQDWYALYSAHFTTVRVMRLYEDHIEDWCGQEPDELGFCPVEMYVPQYHQFPRYVSVDSNYTTLEPFLAEQLDGDWVSTHFCNFGFMCGAVQGDDATWKLQYIDLSQVPDRVLSITDRFGYFELPRSLTLKRCVDMSMWEPGNGDISLTGIMQFNLNSDDK